MTPQDDAIFEQNTPLMVLVRPQMGRNIGAAARAMLNFGCARMRVVAPRDGWPNPDAVALASGASPVLDRAGLFDDLPSAVADCDYIYATTARGRGITKPVLTPERAMAEATCDDSGRQARGGAVRGRNALAGKRGRGARQCHHHSTGESCLLLVESGAMCVAWWPMSSCAKPPTRRPGSARHGWHGICHRGWSAKSLGDHVDPTQLGQDRVLLSAGPRPPSMKLTLPQHVGRRLPLTRADVTAHCTAYMRQYGPHAVTRTDA